MKPIVPADGRYLPLTQESYHCVPTCISMIMYKHNLPLIPQQVLGHHMGVVVPPKLRHLFWNPRRERRPNGRYGISISKQEHMPNNVFKRLGIPLMVTYHLIEEFDAKSFRAFMKEAVRKNKDIIVNFDHGELKGDHKPGGHACLLDQVDLKKDTVRLIDPQQSQPKWRIVKISKLKKAMEFHRANGRLGGFWEFTRVRR